MARVFSQSGELVVDAQGVGVLRRLGRLRAVLKSSVFESTLWRDRPLPVVNVCLYGWKLARVDERGRSTLSFPTRVREARASV